MSISGQFELEFTRDGAVFDEQAVPTLLQGLDGISDLLVLAHGWNNDMQDARGLYDQLVASLNGVAPDITRFGDRKLAVLRLFWPSKRFADSDLIPGGGAASASGENDQALVSLLQELKRDPLRLGGTEVDAARAANIDAAIAQIGGLANSESARREFVLRIRAILNPDQASVDDGSTDFFAREPEHLFDALGTPVPLDLPATSVGGAADLGDGGAAFLGDLLDGASAAARRIANYATYYQMKTRAGTVGRVGAASALIRVRERWPDMALHLVGHSFGARLVTAAASFLPPESRAVTLTLLQGAFSHNGLAQKFDQQHDGTFRTVLADRRVSGPVVITHTKNDTAVGVAYPLASRIARDSSAALGDENDPYGGMGRNGAQLTPEVSTTESELRDVHGSYAFTRGNVFNLKADRFISNHSDVTGPQVANALAQSIVSA
jgi:hypothetical protein